MVACGNMELCTHAGSIKGDSVQRQGSVAERHSTLSNDRKFMLDMLYAKSSTSSGTGSNSGPLKSPSMDESLAESGGVEDASISSLAGRLSSLRSHSSQSSEDASRRAELEGLGGSAQAARARLAEEQKHRRVRPQYSIDAETHSRSLEKTMMTPLSRDNQEAWENLQPSSKALRIKDLDFSDLLEEEDIDVLDIDTFDTGMVNGIPPPPPPGGGLGCLPPPPPPPPPLPSSVFVSYRALKMFMQNDVLQSATPTDPTCSFCLMLGQHGRRTTAS